MPGKNKVDIKSLEFIYEELKDSWEFQKESLFIVQNKANWILTTDALILTAIFFQTKPPNEILLYSAGCLTISMICIFIILLIWPFIRGPSHNELLSASKYSYSSILRKISEAKVDVIKKNQPFITALKYSLNGAVLFLFFGLSAILIRYIYNSLHNV